MIPTALAQLNPYRTLTRYEFKKNSLQSNPCSTHLPFSSNPNPIRIIGGNYFVLRILNARIHEVCSRFSLKPDFL